MAKQFDHKPIMLQQCISYLDIQPDGVYIDCTAGGGGHSQAILDRLTGDGRLIDIDKDIEALDACKTRFASHQYRDKVTFVHSDYKNIVGIINQLSVDKVDGILIDLGVSSYQLDNRERGFSYLDRDMQLDMRMDCSQQLDAKTVINTYSQQQLANILDNYGEEKFARNIAGNIVKVRQTQPINTVGQLLDIIDMSIPAKFRFTGSHPAKRTFQAIRIEVNQELEGLDECLNNMIDCLKVGGNMVVLTFHSLEDRIVKRVFVDNTIDCICPPSSPICICNHRAKVKLLTKKPITADQQELLENSRSNSCKLRAITKIR